VLGTSRRLGAPTEAASEGHAVERRRDQAQRRQHAGADNDRHPDVARIHPPSRPQSRTMTIVGRYRSRPRYVAVIEPKRRRAAVRFGGRARVAMRPTNLGSQVNRVVVPFRGRPIPPLSDSSFDCVRTPEKGCGANNADHRDHTLGKIRRCCIKDERPEQEPGRQDGESRGDSECVLSFHGLTRWHIRPPVAVLYSLLVKRRPRRSRPSLFTRKSCARCATVFCHLELCSIIECTWATRLRLRDYKGTGPAAAAMCGGARRTTRKKTSAVGQPRLWEGGRSGDYDVTSCGCDDRLTVSS
jgi:hypothetical protein